ncbi:MAG: hypothetical protein WCO85_00505 [Actinomycetes bacterium]
MSTGLKKYDPAIKWNGPTRPYDLVKEIVIAILVVGLLVVGLATLFSSPDEPALSLKSWAIAEPADFVQTATGELAGSTTSAGYGAPYNTAAEGQVLGPLKLQKWAGVRIPINPATDFVVKPLQILPDAAVKTAVDTWSAASADQQGKWATAYADALAKAPKETSVADTANAFGPVPAMVTSLLGMAVNGALDGALTTSDTTLPTDFTKPMLFIADSGTYFPDYAGARHLSGDQWGVMNETGSYPGQSWLWLFSFWYQVDPFKSSENADTQVMGLMALLSFALMFLPLIPGLRRIPFLIPIHRLIWRRWYRRKEQ